MRGSARALLGSGVVLVAGTLALGVQAAAIENPSPPDRMVCPTLQESEEHLAATGTDYKPAAPCSADGLVTSPDPTEVPSPDLDDAAAFAKDKVFLMSLTRGPETDGNPSTIEAVTPDGGDVVIFVQTTQPEIFRDMTPQQFAQRVYGE